MIAVAALVAALCAAAMATRALRHDARRRLPWTPSAPWFGAITFAILLARGPADARPAGARPAAPSRARPITVEVVELAAQPALVRTVRARPAELASALAPAIFTLVSVAQRRRIAVSGPPFARYVSRGSTTDPTLVVDVGLPVLAVPAGTALDDDTRIDALPAGPAARITFRGRHDHLPRAHAVLDTWLGTNRRIAAGPRWESYVTNPITTKPDAQRTLVFVPLTPRP